MRPPFSFVPHDDTMFDTVLSLKGSKRGVQKDSHEVGAKQFVQMIEDISIVIDLSR